MKILAFGMNGFVGSRVVQLLQEKHQFEMVSRSTGVDVTDATAVLQKISETEAGVVFNFSAKANVDLCEADKTLGVNGEAWKVNVEGAKNLVAACEKHNKKLLHISTDFVFSGHDAPERGYTEEAVLSPINWYGETKAKADEVILASLANHIILRPAFPYTFLSSPKHFVAAMYQRLSQHQPIAGITDEMFTPTWIDDIANAIDVLLAHDAVGVYHVGSATSVTPYEIALQIAKTFHFDTSLISDTTREKYFQAKANRPFNTSLNSDKIMSLGMKVTSFERGLDLIKKQQAL